MSINSAYEFLASLLVLTGVNVSGSPHVLSVSSQAKNLGTEIGFPIEVARELRSDLEMSAVLSIGLADGRDAQVSLRWSETPVIDNRSGTGIGFEGGEVGHLTYFDLYPSPDIPRSEARTRRAFDDTYANRRCRTGVRLELHVEVRLEEGLSCSKAFPFPISYASARISTRIFCLLRLSDTRLGNTNPRPIDTALLSQMRMGKINRSARLHVCRSYR